jgi:hypothetical protein
METHADGVRLLGTAQEMSHGGENSAEVLYQDGDGCSGSLSGVLEWVLGVFPGDGCLHSVQGSWQ